jgi:hypothetical protein
MDTPVETSNSADARKRLKPKLPIIKKIKAGKHIFMLIDACNCHAAAISKRKKQLRPQ